MPDSSMKFEALEKAISNTFEGIAFSQVLDCSFLALEPELKGGEIGVCLSLPDPANLKFTLVMGKAHAVECFQAVAPGIDLEKISDYIIADFVKELTNTVAGHLNAILVPHNEDMTIGLPVLLESDELSRELKPTAKREVLRFQIEEHGLFCTLT